MPWYTVIGAGESTGRPRRRRYFAADEADARRQAAADATRVDTVEPDPPRGATDRQIAYARDLGIPLPEEATVEEARDLIACVVSGPVAPELAAYLGATGRAAPKSQEIAAYLTTRHEQAQWYLLNVARHLWHANWQHPLAAGIPFDFSTLADDFLADADAARSFDRAAPEPGSTWPRLIEIAHGGTDIESVNTTAYRRACALLDQRQPRPVASPISAPSRSARPSRTASASPSASAALAPCRHCKAQVSPAAKTCPHCGVDNPAQSLFTRLLLEVSAPGFLAAAAVLYLGVRCSADTPPPTAAERAAREQARAAADATCRTSATCWGERHMFAASVACRQLAARHGKHAVRWPDVGLIATFAPVEWAAGQSTIYYVGQAEFQNGFGAWTPYVVRCEVDIRTDDALQVNLTQGRL